MGSVYGHVRNTAVGSAFHFQTKLLLDSLMSPSPQFNTEGQGLIKQKFKVPPSINPMRDFCICHIRVRWGEVGWGWWRWVNCRQTLSHMHPLIWPVKHTHANQSWSESSSSTCCELWSGLQKWGGAQLWYSPPVAAAVWFVFENSI